MSTWASSTVTILPPKAAAWAPTSARKHLRVFPLAANEDAAEKGVPAVGLLCMKRNARGKQEVPLGGWKEEGAASTGISRHLERIEDDEKRDIDEIARIDISLRESSGTARTSSSRTYGKDDSSPSATPTQTTNGWERFIDRSYETFPHGTPRLAALQSSSDSLSIWRRFSRTHCRLLQRLQNQITALEQKLDLLDEQDAGTDMDYRLARNDWQKDWDRTQEDLLDELKSKILEYDDLLLKDSQLRRLAPTPPRDHQHLFNWIYGTKPLFRGHYDFALHNHDFITSSDLANNANAFDDFIESCLSRWPASRFSWFMRRDEDLQDPHVRFFSRERIKIAGKILTLGIAVSILLIPIFLFSLLDLSRKVTSIIVFVFVLIFAMVISLFTGASVDSLFFGTCAYAAVLVTFLGNVQPMTLGVQVS